MKKKALKIIAGITGIILIGVILFLANSVIGNPISSMIAEKDIKEYVEKVYPNLHLEIENPKYSFKSNNYSAYATSKTSIDTRFYIYWANGSVQRDDYKSYVLGLFNTHIRLEESATNEVNPLLSKVEGVQKARAEFKNENSDKSYNIIKLDMPFEKSSKVPFTISINVNGEDRSFTNFSRIFESTHKILKDNGYNTVYYNIYSEDDNGYCLATINNVSVEEIESGNLETLLQESYANKAADEIADKDKDKEKTQVEKRISIFIK
ncbi:MAG: hypothetical protein RSA29_06380 [Clostridium sp.]|uniref:YfjL-like protein n=1 Tax=Clostridium sp. TaxID=1506 RepID=UPI00304A07F7